MAGVLAHLQGRRLGMILVVTGALWGYFQSDLTCASSHSSLSHHQGEDDRVAQLPARLLPSQSAVLLAPLIRDQISTGAPSDLIVKAVHVQNGDFVHAGQVVFELEAAALQGIVKRREKEHAAANLELERAKLFAAINPRTRDLALTSADAYLTFRTEDFDTRKREFDTYERLARVNAAKEFEVYEAKSKYAQARYDLVDAKRRLQLVHDAIAVGTLQDKLDLARATSAAEAADNALNQARLLVDQCQVKSPLNGFLDQVALVPGQVVTGNAPLGKVINVDPIERSMKRDPSSNTFAGANHH